MGHRYYDPGTGRFLTRDPIGYKGGINLYGFAGNNPVNESDPSGFGPTLGQPIPDPLEKGMERVWEKLAPGIARQLIRPAGTGLRMMGGTAAAGVTLFFMAQTRVADSSTGPGSPYAAAHPRQQRITLPRYRATPEDPALSEQAFRNLLEAQDITLAPKNGVYSGGPDAIRTGGAPTMWAFAELKPENPISRKALGSQVRARLRNGVQGPGDLYAYSKDANGNYEFRYIGIITGPNERITR